MRQTTGSVTEHPRSPRVRARRPTQSVETVPWQEAALNYMYTRHARIDDGNGRSIDVLHIYSTYNVHVYTVFHEEHL